MKLIHSESNPFATDRVLVFGSTGGIGSAVCDLLHIMRPPVKVTEIDKRTLNFYFDPGSYATHKLLESANADVVINCVGVFRNDSHTIQETFEVNFGSNWSIIRHYRNNPPKKPVHIIMVGSSAYNGPRRNYMLYAASKAALYSLWQSASEYFLGTEVCISLINPVKVKTRMSNAGIEPLDVAKVIVKTAFDPNPYSQCINM